MFRKDKKVRTRNRQIDEKVGNLFSASAKSWVVKTEIMYCKFEMLKAQIVYSVEQNNDFYLVTFALAL
jgi:hypothetical protein